MDLDPHAIFTSNGSQIYRWKQKRIRQQRFIIYAIEFYECGRYEGKYGARNSVASFVRQELFEDVANRYSASNSALR